VTKTGSLLVLRCEDARRGGAFLRTTRHQGGLRGTTSIRYLNAAS